ncbi:MAG: hypothetical protein WAK53_18655 [Chromatiaceae bacterium]|jgi:hypothetical protein
MKMNFTKKEYQTLVEMLLLADWVITGHDVEERAATKPYRELRKKVLAHHKEMGMADAFKYSPKEDEYFETAAYEENAPHMRFIEEHNEQVFWMELASRLAARDLAAEETICAEGEGSEEERVTGLFEITDRYEEELAENGLDNLRIVREGSRVH